MSEWKPKKFFTEEQVEAAQTAKGGFSCESMRKLGVPWPPPKGWRAAITRRPAAPVQRMERVVGLGDDPRKRKPSDWIALNPMLKYAFSRQELALDRSPLR